MAVLAHVASSINGILRPFDMRRDLNDVADLVELCFADTMDSDGQRYLKGMREAARNSSLLNWAGMLVEQPSIPLSGYVWEEDGRLVGNLSLIPFLLRGQRRYLIANVAVHPAYRRRGIARALTARAIEHAHQRGAPSTWLQVREDNPPAIHLYRSLGFQERARRTTWGSISSSQEPFLPVRPGAISGVTVIPGGATYWAQERAWLECNYPPEIAWHLPFNLNNLRPGLWGSFFRIFNGSQARHWLSLWSGKPRAALVWQTLHAPSDLLWLAASPGAGDGILNDGIIYELLRSARQGLSSRRPLTLDYPAGQAVQAIRAAGFQPKHTLIWMEVTFQSWGK